MESGSTFWSAASVMSSVWSFSLGLCQPFANIISEPVCVCWLWLCDVQHMSGPNENLTQSCFVRKGRIEGRKRSKKVKNTQKKAPFVGWLAFPRDAFPCAKCHGSISIRCNSLSIRHSYQALLKPVQIRETETLPLFLQIAKVTRTIIRTQIFAYMHR